MLKSQTYKKGVIVSTSLNFFAKAVGFINTMLIAYYFGTQIGTDIYFFVIGISALISVGMINTIDNIILIPHAMKLRETEGEESSRKFLNFFIFLYVVIGIVISTLILISPSIFYNTFSKYPPAVLKKYELILYAGGILIFFQLANNFLGAILNSFRFFSINILTGLANSIICIIITVLFHKSLGIAGTLFALSFSYGLNFIFLILVMKFRLGWNFKKFSTGKSKTVWGNIGLMQLNTLPVWVRNYVTLFLLTGLGEGVVSSINLSQQASAIIDTFIIAQILSVAGIKFNELASKGSMNELNSLFFKINEYLLLILSPVVILTFFYSREIASIIFERGYMGKNSLETVALCLKYLILLLPFTMLNSISTRIFSAAQVIRQSILYSMMAHVIFLVLTIVFIKTMHLKGYLISLIAGYAVLIFLFYRLYKLKLKEINFDRVLLFGLQQLLINLAITIPVYFLLKSLPELHNSFVLFFSAVLIQFIILAVINRNHTDVLKVMNYLKNIKLRNNVE